MGQINVEKNVNGIEGLCAITPAVYGITAAILWKRIASVIWKKQFLIPKGFAHGFLVLSHTAEFCCKCDDFYHPGDEGSLAWNLRLVSSGQS